MKLDSGLDIGGLTFEGANYDAENDVLYLARGPSNIAECTEFTPEGHAVRCNTDGDVIGITIMNPKWLLERDGHLKITIPIPREVRISADELSPAFALAKTAA